MVSNNLKVSIAHILFGSPVHNVDLCFAGMYLLFRFTVLFQKHHPTLNFFFTKHQLELKEEMHGHLAKYAISVMPNWTTVKAIQLSTPALSLFPEADI
jgi:hypothetical protein